MLARAIILVSIAVVLATQVPGLASWARRFLHSSDSQAPPQRQALKADDVVWLKPDRQGHFSGMFQINGQPVQAIVDTGASYVALDEKMARHLGFSSESLEFRFPVKTANGEILAAHVWLERVEIGAIRLDKVEAYIVKDQDLPNALIGVSFLARLRSYAVISGSLALIR